jgi:hypothetical protein
MIDEQNPEDINALQQMVAQKQAEQSKLMANQTQLGQDATAHPGASIEQLIAGALVAGLPALVGGAVGGKRGIGFGAQAGGVAAGDMFKRVEDSNELDRKAAALKYQQNEKGIATTGSDIDKLKLEQFKADRSDKKTEEDRDYVKKKDAKIDAKDQSKLKLELDKFDFEKKKQATDKDGNTIKERQQILNEKKFDLEKQKAELDRLKFETFAEDRDLDRADRKENNVANRDVKVNKYGSDDEFRKQQFTAKQEEFLKSYDQKSKQIDAEIAKNDKELKLQEDRVDLTRRDVDRRDKSADLKNSGTGLKSVSLDTKKKMEAYNQTKEIGGGYIKRFEEEAKKNPGWADRNVESALPATALGALKNDLGLFAVQIRGARESGVMTEQDYKRYNEYLNITPLDTMGSVLRRLKELDRVTDTTAKAVLNSAEDARENVDTYRKSTGFVKPAVMGDSIKPKVDVDKLNAILEQIAAKKKAQQGNQP